MKTVERMALYHAIKSKGMLQRKSLPQVPQNRAMYFTLSNSVEI